MNSIVSLDAILLVLGISSSARAEETSLATLCKSQAEAAVRRFLMYDPTQAERTEFYPGMDFGMAGLQVWESNETEAYLRSLAEASTDELQVRHIPIRSVSSLKVDYDGRAGSRAGSFPSSSAWTEGTDFWPNYTLVDSLSAKVCKDGIIRSEGRWPTRAGSVKIVYTAGYTSGELAGTDSVIDASPIVEAALDEAQRRFLKIQSRKKKTLSGFAGPLTSESLGEYSYSVDSSVRQSIIGGGDLSGENKERLQEFVNLGYAISG